MRLKQIGSAGNKTRRYHERPNETSNTEVKETMKVAITAKRVVILMMTMALAVALVACTGAVKQGPPGEKGDKGDQGDPGTTPAGTPDPGDTPTELGAIKKLMDPDPVIFDNDSMGKVSTESMAFMLDKYFHPSGLDFMIDGEVSKHVSAEIMGSELTVSVMENADYMTHMVKVKASNEIDSETVTFKVRRNQAPMAGKGMPLALGTAANSDATEGRDYIWVTSKAKTIKTMMASGRKTGTEMVSEPEAIFIAIGGSSADKDKAHFVDDAENKLSFTADLMPSKARMLMVTGGEEMIKLVGSKTTRTGAGSDEDDPSDDVDEPITLKLFATDDGELMQTDDSVEVFKVRIDAPPKVMGSIALQVMTLGDTLKEYRDVTGIAQLFSDDRADPTPGGTADAAETHLMYYAWSSDKTVAVVAGNPENKMDMAITFTNGVDSDTTNGTTSANDGYKIMAMSRGTATITVKAMEPKLIPDGATDPASSDENAAAAGAGGMQAAELTFEVEVN